MRFGAVMLVTENPELVMASPYAGTLHLELINTGHVMLWVGDETLRKASFSSAFDYETLPPIPSNGRQIYPGEVMHLRMEPNDRLYVCRIRTQIHVASATIDWRSELTWTIVEESGTGV